MIAELFRAFPAKKFTLKALASASGGNDREGRTRTREIVQSMVREGAIREVAPGQYKQSVARLTAYQGTVDMTSSGAVYVRVAGQDKDMFVDERNAAHALQDDVVKVVIIRRRRSPRSSSPSRAARAQASPAGSRSPSGSRYTARNTAAEKAPANQASLRTGRPRVVSPAQDIVRAGVVELRQLEQGPHRDLPDALLVAAVDLQIHIQVGRHRPLGQIAVYSEIRNTAKIHTIT